MFVNFIKMAFKRVKGGDKGFSEPRTVSSLTSVVGALLTYDRTNEVLIAATSSTTPEDIAGVSVAAIASADTTAQVQEVCDGDEYIADTTNNSSTAHNYHRMLLTDSVTVNNTATDDTTDAAVIEQIAPVGAAADKKILCRIVRVQDRAA